MTLILIHSMQATMRISALSATLIHPTYKYIIMQHVMMAIIKMCVFVYSKVDARPIEGLSVEFCHQSCDVTRWAESRGLISQGTGHYIVLKESTRACV